MPPRLFLSEYKHHELLQSQKSCKLLKLTLKTFKGETGQWLEFWDSFESAIHNNPKISAVDKL